MMKLLIPLLFAAVFVPLFIWLFVFIRRESKKIVVKSFQDLEREGIPDYKCPRCNTYMEVGYSVAGKGMMFRNKNMQFKVVAPGRLLRNTANWGFKIRENLAWKCANCQLIVVDYGFQIKK